MVPSESDALAPPPVWVDFPAGWRVDTARATPASALSLDTAARVALARPVEGSRLQTLAHSGMRVTVVVPDQTRACPLHVLLPLALAELEAGGVSRADITLLLALGMHRELEPEELIRWLGESASHLRVLQSQGSRAADFRDRGTLTPEETGLPLAIPVRLHPATGECDLLVSIGLVEPHQYAGWSGGPKTVAIGCASAETIAHLHSPEVLEHSGTRLGTLADNPLHRALELIAARAGLAFCLNVALDETGHPLAVACGKPSAVLEDLVQRSEPHVRCAVDAPYDAVFAGVEAHKAVNLYQASRALTYIAFGPQPVVKPGGWIVAKASCPEGLGRGPAEQEFQRAMHSGSNAAGVLEATRRGAFAGGGQRAMLVAKALLRYRLLIVGAQDPDLVRSCHLDVEATEASALVRLRTALPHNARVLVVPNAFAVIPVPRAT